MVNKIVGDEMRFYCPNPKFMLRNGHKFLCSKNISTVAVMYKQTSIVKGLLSILGLFSGYSTLANIIN